MRGHGKTGEGTQYRKGGFLSPSRGQWFLTLVPSQNNRESLLSRLFQL